MILTFSSAIEASDAGRRIISGVVVPFNKVGHTSVGQVIFERGSIAIHENAKIKLLMQHEPNNPIGRAQSFSTTPDAIYGSFKISASQKGTDALLLASEDLISGLSVGVEVISSRENKDGVMVVSSAVLKEVSLVESPAFSDAIVTNVAASESEAAQEETPTISESEAIVEVKAPEAVQTEVEAAPVVEASRPTLKASAPYSTQTVRHGINSMGRYTEHKIKAALGSEDSKLWIAAAEDPKVVQAAADSIGTTNPAFNPIQYMREFVSNTNFNRPAVDAVSKGVLPTVGMSFQVPKLTTAPTVASTAEAAAPSDTGMVSAYLTGTVTKYAGQNTISVELLERSDPLFFDELTIQMQRAYLAATDASVIAALISGGTIASAQDFTSAGIIGYVSTEAPAAYAATSYFAQNYLAGQAHWSTLLGATDSTGRPIYNASNPMNNAGVSAPGSIKGNVLGLSLYVDHNALTTSADNSAFIIAPECVTFYESPTSYFSVNLVSSMQVQTAIYGYASTLVKQAAGIRKWNLT